MEEALAAVPGIFSALSTAAPLVATAATAAGVYESIDASNKASKAQSDAASQVAATQQAAQAQQDALAKQQADAQAAAKATQDQQQAEADSITAEQKRRQALGGKSGLLTFLDSGDNGVGSGGGLSTLLGGGSK